MMSVSIRRFEKKDIPNKVKWINDPENNTFLHYDLPLEIGKTESWFEKNKDRTDRYDAVIDVNSIPVGLIGLLSIDKKNKKAECYITIGEREYLGKGIAYKATNLLLEYAFTDLGLNCVYLFTEVDNIAAVRLYKRAGFKCEGILKDDLFYKGRFVDRYIYGITKKDYCHFVDTPIQRLCEIKENSVYVKREDFIPYSFGGNKARKAQLFFDEIKRGDFDCVVTYGSSSSNHCRVVANMAAARNMPCYIISPKEASERTYNSSLLDLFGAEVTICSVDQVSDTIECKLTNLREQGRKPYFIAGGGHGILGTQAYVDCYEEIRRFEKANNIVFDYIFHASGTGTTQAGLVCGQLINRDDRHIVGISIARNNPRGRNVVLESVREYLAEYHVHVTNDLIEKTVNFVDDYIGDGYGSYVSAVERIIQFVMKQHGIPLDSTYTGKAFSGMMNYLEKETITGKNILFIHTGGTPLFFDYLEKRENT